MANVAAQYAARPSQDVHFRHHEDGSDLSSFARLGEFVLESHAQNGDEDMIFIGSGGDSHPLGYASGVAAHFAPRHDYVGAEAKGQARRATWASTYPVPASNDGQLFLDSEGQADVAHSYGHQLTSSDMAGPSRIRHHAAGSTDAGRRPATSLARPSASVAQPYQQDDLWVDDGLRRKHQVLHAAAMGQEVALDDLLDSIDPDGSGVFEDLALEQEQEWLWRKGEESRMQQAMLAERQRLAAAEEMRLEELRRADEILRHQAADEEQRRALHAQQSRAQADMWLRQQQQEERRRRETDIAAQAAAAIAAEEDQRRHLAEILAEEARERRQRKLREQELQQQQQQHFQREFLLEQQQIAEQHVMVEQQRLQQMLWEQQKQHMHHQQHVEATQRSIGSRSPSPSQTASAFAAQKLNMGARSPDSHAERWLPQGCQKGKRASWKAPMAEELFQNSNDSSSSAMKPQHVESPSDDSDHGSGGPFGASQHASPMQQQSAAARQRSRVESMGDVDASQRQGQPLSDGDRRQAARWKAPQIEELIDQHANEAVAANNIGITTQEPQQPSLVGERGSPEGFTLNGTSSTNVDDAPQATVTQDGTSATTKEDVDADETLYAVLGIQEDATADDIRKAYKKKCVRHHPDKGGSREKFEQIAQAYKVLSDPRLREVYDARGLEGVEEVQANDNVANTEAQQAQIHQAQAQPVVTQCQIPLEIAFAGGSIDAQIVRIMSCVACEGSGLSPGGYYVHCQTCAGVGDVAQLMQVGPLVFEQRGICASCVGEGKVLPPHCLCTECNGEQLVEQQATVHFDIPLGVSNNERIVAPGQGHQMAGMAAGDVILVCDVQEHGRFFRQGDDLLAEQNVPLQVAMCGGAIEVQHLNGRTVIARLTRGSVLAPGSMKCLPGEGMPKRHNPHLRGDLVLRFAVNFPDAIPEELAERIERCFLGDKAPPASGKAAVVDPPAACGESEVYLADFDIAEFGKQLHQASREAHDSDYEDANAPPLRYAGDPIGQYFQHVAGHPGSPPCRQM